MRWSWTIPRTIAGDRPRTFKAQLTFQYPGLPVALALPLLDQPDHLTVRSISCRAPRKAYFQGSPRHLGAAPYFFTFHTSGSLWEVRKHGTVASGGWPFRGLVPSAASGSCSDDPNEGLRSVPRSHQPTYFVIEPSDYVIHWSWAAAPNYAVNVPMIPEDSENRDVSPFEYLDGTLPVRESGSEEASGRSSMLDLRDGRSPSRGRGCLPAKCNDRKIIRAAWGSSGESSRPADRLRLNAAKALSTLASASPLKMAAQIPLASARHGRHPPAHVSLHLRLPRGSLAPSWRIAPNLSLPENSQSHGCHHMATIPGPDSSDNLPRPLSRPCPPSLGPLPSPLPAAFVFSPSAMPYKDVYARFLAPSRRSLNRESEQRTLTELNPLARDRFLSAKPMFSENRRLPFGSPRSPLHSSRWPFLHQGNAGDSASGFRYFVTDWSVARWKWTNYFKQILWGFS